MPMPAHAQAMKKKLRGAELKDGRNRSLRKRLIIKKEGNEIRDTRPIGGDAPGLTGHKGAGNWAKARGCGGSRAPRIRRCGGASVGHGHFQA